MTTSEPPNAPAPPAAPPPAPPPAAPPPPGAPTAQAAFRWRSLRSWSSAVFVAFGTVAAVIVAVLVTEIQQLSALSDAASSVSELRHQIELDHRIDDLNDVFLGLVLIAAVVFVTWMWRAAKNNEALGRVRPRFGPGWAIGGWMIPVAFLVIPVLLVQDLWRGSEASIPRGDVRWKIGDRSALVGWWWGLLIASRILNLVGNGVADAGTVTDVRQGIAIQALGNALLVASAVLAVLMVRRLSQRQEECLRVQHERWQQQGTAPAPPG